MKGRSTIFLIAAALIWSCCASIAAAQVPWSEESYDALVSGDSSATIPPGTKITPQNWQQYKNFMPAGLQQLFAGKLSWSLPPETVVEVEPTAPTPLPRKYQEDTEKLASQVSLVQNSDGGYSIKGYVAGVPFPKPSGAAAGVEVLYNEYYAYIPYLITTYSHLGFSMDRYANKYQTEVREVNFKLKHLSDLGKPTNIPDTGDLFLTQNNVIWEPEQSKYVNALQIFHDNPGDLPESYVFVPSLRRSIRLTTAARCSPLVGSDYTQDDERSMNLQPPIFQSKFLGYKKILVGYPEAGYVKTANYYKPLYFPTPDAVKWQVRTVALLDLRRLPSKEAGYCYGSRMAFIDKETWQPIWMDLYDVGLKLWKIGPSVYRPMPLPGTNGDVSTGAGGPGDGIYTFWDVQNNHLTLDIQDGGLINSDAPKSFDDFTRWGTPAGMQQVMQ